jgi:hypothetical protein
VASDTASVDRRSQDDPDAVGTGCDGVRSPARGDQGIDDDLAGDVDVVQDEQRHGEQRPRVTTTQLPGKFQVGTGHPRQELRLDTAIDQIRHETPQRVR